MAITAREEKRHLIIDLGDDETVFRIPPIPGKIGREATALLVGVSMGMSGDLEVIEADADRLARLCLGEGLPGFDEMFEKYENLRGTEQTLVGQAAIFWNCQGGSIDAVNDILDTSPGSGLPKALGRVMQSYGLGEQYKRLTTFLNGESQEQN